MKSINKKQSYITVSKLKPDTYAICTCIVAMTSIIIEVFADQSHMEINLFIRIGLILLVIMFGVGALLERVET